MTMTQVPTTTLDVFRHMLAETLRTTTGFAWTVTPSTFVLVSPTQPVALKVVYSPNNARMLMVRAIERHTETDLTNEELIDERDKLITTAIDVDPFNVREAAQHVATVLLPEANRAITVLHHERARIAPLVVKQH